ncbi:hypothetical protein [Glycomyces paridis]|uniref:Uncharacterized protein n=1 Tax=Glycomyces paridis TaxID=2126555 RepID=A0A4S8PDB6_9ACTN|nr:hypothetical protein [Glycomyces paridis]THV27545.1 hypothetical protein E9998_14115 [Glycomyces paridis]
MRKTRFASAAAAAALAAGSLLALGQAASAAPQDVPPGGEHLPESVVLPTGDRITLLPNGTAGIEPAPGREGTSFLTPPSPSGDLVVVPTDRVAAITAGDEDPRRYNVSELLRGDHTDAAALTESELDQRAYAGLVPDTFPATTLAADDLRKFHLDLRTRAGKAPDGAWVLWAARDGSDFGSIEIDENGGASEALAPGDYVIVTGFWNDATDTRRGETTIGMTPVTVTDDDVTELLVEAADARPVSVEVEQSDAALLNAAFYMGAESADANLGYGTYLGPNDDAFLLPEPDLPEFERSFIYQPVLASPEGAADPYVYNLAFHDASGYPADTAFAPADDDLAVLAADYRDLGTPVDGQTCGYGDLTEGQIGMGYCRLVDTPVPSQRTMYYTADPEITWDNGLRAGLRDADGEMTDGFVASYEESFEPGPTARTIPNGGLSSGPVDATRGTDSGTEFFFAGTPVGGANDESLQLIGALGGYELTRDGELLASADGYDFYWDSAFTELPAGDAGRYTFTTELAQAPTTVDFGTSVSSSWSFDSESMPEGEFDRLAFPYVVLAADDLAGGYGDRRACQEVTLEMRTDEYGPVAHAEDMTFEVSYDDGATWKAVDLDRDGDTATAELRHPRKAKWVSIRTTALADNGTEVTNTVIRAYGLK